MTDFTRHHRGRPGWGLHNGPDSNTWGFMGGTGKYAGIKGGGTTTSLAQMADGRAAIRWDGHWTMK